MNIYVDLDGTLFDTVRLGKDTSILLSNTFGIAPEEYEEARQEMFRTNNKIYSAELHARILAGLVGKDESELVRYFTKLFLEEDSHKYLFPDSVEFLKSCQSIGRASILTFGESLVQNPRATKSGLRDLVSEVIVTQKSKGTTIREDLLTHDISKLETIALVDDTIEHLDNVRKEFPSSLTIHIARNTQTIAPTQHIQVSTLSEAYKILVVKS